MSHDLTPVSENAEGPTVLDPLMSALIRRNGELVIERDRAIRRLDDVMQTHADVLADKYTPEGAERESGYVPYWMEGDEIDPLTDLDSMGHRL